MKRLVKKWLPPTAQSFFRRLYYRYPLLRRLYYLPVNLGEALRGKRGPLQPPRSKVFVGDGDFLAIGRKFLGYFRELCQLRPDEKVLEIGCGIGRMAIPLTAFLDDRGRYTGMDIVPEGIKWCRRKVTPRFPHFDFFLADIYNEQYNPRGRHHAGDYRLPLADAACDFVFLTSVFTHMLPADLAHYLAEISRILRPGGRCLITYFLLNAEAEAMLSGRDHPFRHAYEDCLVIDAKMPEASIAHPEARIRAWYDRLGLAIRPPIRYGSWCGRSHFLSFQDIVIADKK